MTNEREGIQGSCAEREENAAGLWGLPRKRGGIGTRGGIRGREGELTNLRRIGGEKKGKGSKKTCRWGEKAFRRGGKKKGRKGEEGAAEARRKKKMAGCIRKKNEKKKKEPNSTATKRTEGG